MSDKKLTQEQIDAMLNNIKNKGKKETNLNIDFIKSFFLNSIEASKEALNSAVGKNISISTRQDFKLSPIDNILTSFEQPYVAIKVEYTGEVDGFDLLIVKKDDAFGLAKLQLENMGMDANDDSILMMKDSASSELMNQMMGKSASILSTSYGLDVNISTPTLYNIESLEDINIISREHNLDFVSMVFNFEIDGTNVSVDVLKILDINFVKNLDALLNSKKGAIIDDNLTSKMEDEDDSIISEGNKSNTQIDVSNIDTSDLLTKYQISDIDNSHQNPRLYGGEHKVDSDNIPKVYPYDLKNLPVDEHNIPFNLSISKLNDVPIDLSVELGRTKRTIKDILDLGKGSIIELNKLSGEPADLYANGILIARAEVVVIKDYFAVKILDIVDEFKN